MSAPASGGQASPETPDRATSPGTVLPATWPQRAARLEQIMCELAALRAEETQLYATAFFAPGTTTDTQRTQRGKQAAAGQHLACERKAAELAAYQLLLTAAVDVTILER